MIREPLGLEPRPSSSSGSALAGADHVDRLLHTILEACRRPSFAFKLTELERDVTRHLGHYNFDRAQTGRVTKGRVPRRIL